MRRLTAGIVCAALVGTAGSALARGTAKPALRVMDTSPLVVRGIHFRPAERITVTVVVQSRHRKTITARATGSFAVSFQTLSPDRCTAYAITAVGDRGSRAALKVNPECPPP